MSRRVARETCFKLIFEYEFLKAENPVTLEELLYENGLEEADKEYINQVYRGVLSKDEQLTEILKQHLTGYTIERIYKIDLTILKLAIYEIKFLNESPAVAINEAVQLSKKYSTEKSYSFINGVLANIVKGE